MLASFDYALQADQSAPSCEKSLCTQAYEGAIKRAVQRLKEEEGEVHALDLGCGAGLFSAMAAKAGATSVVACDMLEPLCIATRKVRNIPETPLTPKELRIRTKCLLMSMGKSVSAP